MQAPLSTAHRHHEAFPRARAGREDDQTACAGQLRISGPPAAVAATIRSADPGARGRLIGQLQRQLGNALVGQLLVADDRPPADRGTLPIQRWSVSLPPATADCMVVVNWLNQHSPYRAKSGWALTSPTFGWSGDFSYSGSGDSLTVSIANPSVSLATTVDMPRWTPTNSTMAGAWAAMTSELRAHEARHEEVATNWKATLLDRLKDLSLSVKSRADGPAAVGKQWSAWLVEHQADQTALDPFSAMLDCSAGGSESADAGGADSGGADLAANGLEADAPAA